MPTLNQTKHPINYISPGAPGTRYPVVIVLHGNLGLGKDIGKRMFSVARMIADLGYLVAVPRYYPDDAPRLADDDPKQHVPILEAVVEDATARTDAAPGKIGLVGYSLGGGIAMWWMAGGAADRVAVFVDFFGYAEADLPDRLNFPPTAIFHNHKDELVPFSSSVGFLGKLHCGVEVRLNGYVEDSAVPFGGNHVFDQNGAADIDSLEQAGAWLQRHLPT